MRELVVVGSGQLQWRSAAAVDLQEPTDALVRPFIAARCDGDALFLRHAWSPLLRVGAALHLVDSDFRSQKTDPFAPPFAYGHEGVAEVTACGSDVRDFQVGDVVIVPWAVSCGTCARCTAGLTSKCARACGERAMACYGLGRAVGGYGGMVSDTLRVPWADRMLVRVPTDVNPMALASASDNLADGYRAVAPYLEQNPGAPVFVVGGGAKSIGLYAAAVAVALGSSRVDYLDDCKIRLALAEHIGARPLRRGKSLSLRGSLGRRDGYPITVDASSTGKGLRLALTALAPGGTCTGVGFYLRCGTALPLWKMYTTGATLHVGLSHARAHLPSIVSLVQRKVLDPTKLTTLVADWEDAPRALLERTTKVVVTRAPLGLRAPGVRPMISKATANGAQDTSLR